MLGRKAGDVCKALMSWRSLTESAADKAPRHAVPSDGCCWVLITQARGHEESLCHRSARLHMAAWQEDRWLCRHRALSPSLTTLHPESASFAVVAAAVTRRRTRQAMAAAAAGAAKQDARPLHNRCDTSIEQAELEGNAQMLLAMAVPQEKCGTHTVGTV